MHRLSAALISSLLAVPACGGPYDLKTVRQKDFVATQRCGQDLVETRFTATGHRWGESISMRSCGPNALQGIFEISVQQVDGPLKWGSAFGGAEARPSDACLSSVGTRADDVGAASSSSSSSSKRRVASDDAAQVRSTSFIEVSTHSEADSACFAKSSLALDTGRLVPGSEIRVRLWSMKPSDLDAALIRLRHVEIHPNMSDEKWKAHLKKEESEWSREPYTPPGKGSEHSANPPPAPLREARPERPVATARWVSGHWRWRASGSEWVWLPGAWRTDQRPPPLRVEQRPAAPFENALWVSGHWQLSVSGFVWIQGRWLRRR